MDSKALLLIFDGYCEFEITTAISMLRDTHLLHTFALEKSPCKSEAGLTTIPDFSIDEVVLENYDVLIIPGGDMKPLVEGKLFNLIKAFHENGGIIAAICSGAYVLAKAGILNGVPYTVTLSKEQRDYLGVFDEVQFIYQPTVQHNNILTAQGHAYVEFGIELISMLRQVSHETKDFYKGIRNHLMEID